MDPTAEPMTDATCTQLDGTADGFIQDAMPLMTLGE